MKKTMIAALGAIIATGAFADRVALPSGDIHSGYGLVEARIAGNDAGYNRGVFRFIANGEITGRNGPAMRTNVPITRSAEPLVYENTSYGSDTDKKTYTSSTAWAPDEVYQTESYGTMTIALDGFTPNATYVAEVHFAETWSANQQRNFGVYANDIPLIVGIRPCSYGFGAAMNFSAEVVADAQGKITFRTVNFNDNAIIGGIAVWGAAKPVLGAVTIDSINRSDIEFSFSGKDVLRYYIQSAADPEGAWTDLAELDASADSYVLPGDYSFSAARYYRVEAVNGNGSVDSAYVAIGGTDSSEHLASRGETIPGGDGVSYLIDHQGTGAVNALAASSVTLNSLFNGYQDDTALALGAGDTLTAAELGILPGAGVFTVGETAGIGTIVPASGRLILGVENDGKDLVINGNVSGNGTIVKTGNGKAVLATGASFNGTVDVKTGALEVPFASNVDFPFSGSRLSGSGSFVKSGAGAVKLATRVDNTFNGEFVIAEGTVKNKLKEPFGGTAKGWVTVKSGATLDATSNENNNEDYTWRWFGVRFEGAGENGQGAITSTTTANNNYQLFRFGEMTGDATVNSPVGKRWDFRSGDSIPPTFKFNGHKLTKIGSGDVYFTSMAIDNSSAYQIDIDEGAIGFEGNTQFLHPDSVINATNGVLRFYNLGSWSAPALASQLNIGKGSNNGIYVRNGNWENNFHKVTGQNRVTGPVTISGTGIVNCENNGGVIVEGPVSGGKLVKKGAGALYLKGGDKNWTGGTRIEGGYVFPYKQEIASETVVSLPGWPDLKDVELAGEGATLCFSPAYGWEYSDYLDALDAGVVVSNPGAGISWMPTEDYTVDEDTEIDSMAMRIMGGVNATYNGKVDTGKGMIYVDSCNVDFKGTVVAGGIDIKNGNVNFASSAQFSEGMNFYVNNATCVVNGVEGDWSLFRHIWLQNYAELMLRNGTYELIYDSANTTSLSMGREYNYNTSQKLILDNARVLPQQTEGFDVSKRSICEMLGWNRANHVVVEMNGDKALLAGQIILGKDLNSEGALWMNGGAVTNICGGGYDGRVAESGYGYMEQNAGTNIWWGYSQIAANKESTGVWAMKGGYFEVLGRNGSLDLGRGGTGTIYQTGGTIVMNGFNVGNGSMGHYTYTVEGEGAYTYVKGGNPMWNQNGGKDGWSQTTILNLREGGVMEARRMSARNQTSVIEAGGVSEMYLNFDGGVLRAMEGGEFWNNGTSQNDFWAGVNGYNLAPSQVTVYKGGAIFDTTNQNVVIHIPLKAPAGKGVASVSFPQAEVAAIDWIGMPEVRFENAPGDPGRGASAVALFDQTTRSLTGFKVTSAGFGYVTAPTVVLQGGGLRQATIVGTATLAENDRTGGVVKRGLPDTTLELRAGSCAAAAHTFGGAIRSEGGRFLIKSNALPGENDLEAVGGDIDLDGQTIAKVGDVVVSDGGTILNGSITEADDVTVGEGSTLALSMTCDNLVVKGGTVTGAMSCSGSLELGSGSLAADQLVFNGNVSFDCEKLVDGNHVTFTGSNAFDLSAITAIDFSNVDKLVAEGQGITLLECPAGFTGSLTATIDGIESPWHVSAANGKIRLTYSTGTMIIFR